jgi:hypothetical protein
VILENPLVGRIIGDAGQINRLLYAAGQDHHAI